MKEIWKKREKNKERRNKTTKNKTVKLLNVNDLFHVKESQARLWRHLAEKVDKLQSEHE